MTDILASGSPTITSLLANLDTYKYNPSAIQQVIFNYLDEVTSGQVNIVDPTNPFVFLLESSAVNTALAVTENLINLRKQYPSLAQTADDLYNHMSDADYINRFATPSDTIFTITIQLNDILNKMALDPIEGVYKATIPRDSKFVVDGMTFTLEYPIDIRKASNGSVQISYDATIPSAIGTLKTNVIQYTVRSDPNGVSWVSFKIDVKQYAVDSQYFPLQKSTAFNQTVTYSDQYYFTRVFYRNATTNNMWTEINVTHSDQVFDPLVPTALLKVYDGNLTVAIPVVYQTNNLISGDLRFDVYTTIGNMTANLSNYKVDAFSLNFVAIDEARDLNAFTTAMTKLTYFAYSDQIISGGTNGLDFATLRDRVIFNSLGPQQIPITNKQATAAIANSNFTLVTNVDNVTNRIFLAIQKLPKPLNTKLLTSANIGISIFITNIDYLKQNGFVADTGQRVTLHSKNLFVQVNGIISILSAADIQAIMGLSKSAMVNQINTTNYLYNPFHYVLDDTNTEFSVRVYNLDYPLASNLSFVSQNQTLQLPVNTSTYSLAKSSTGYSLTITTKSGSFYKQLTDGLVAAQIGFTPTGESKMAFINGTLIGNDSTGERIYRFDIQSNFDIDENDQIQILNAKMFGSESVATWMPLDTVFDLFYTTTSIVENFVNGEADAIFGSFILPKGSVVSTHETINLSLGTALANLWARSRSLATGLEYELQPVDVPMLYEKDTYAMDTTNGSILTIDDNGVASYNLLHKKGDPVLDNSGNQVYKYRKGDVVLDTNGNPVLLNPLAIDKEIDMLFIDGKHYFVNDSAFLDYNNEVVGVLDSWITNDIVLIQDELLEQSKIYFYPNSNLGTTNINIKDYGQDRISSEQSFVVDLYVSADVYNNTDIRSKLSVTTVTALDSYISNTVINISELENIVKALYGNSVQSVRISGLGGAANYQIVTLASEENRLCLKKNLVVQQDGSFIIAEDVTINFYRI